MTARPPRVVPYTETHLCFTSLISYLQLLMGQMKHTRALCSVNISVRRPAQDNAAINNLVLFERYFQANSDASEGRKAQYF